MIFVSLIKSISSHLSTIFLHLHRPRPAKTRPKVGPGLHHLTKFRWQTRWRTPNLESTCHFPVAADMSLDVLWTFSWCKKTISEDRLERLWKCCPVLHWNFITCCEIMSSANNVPEFTCDRTRFTSPAKKSFNPDLQSGMCHILPYSAQHCPT